jgi:6-pyruvoyltetrahydropterin/6-carboxytetrahydropterin synthase
MIVKQGFSFEAAHRLPKHPGKCFNLHGHSYRFMLSLDCPVNPDTGMTIDFGDIVAAVHEHILDVWDHKNLNDFMDNPTAEHIVVEIWDKLAGKLPGLKEIELWEIPESSVVYRGELSRGKGA